MTAFRVLHLSDLHIGNTYIRSGELADKIANDIAQNGLTGIRCVLVTGDIFNGPSGNTPALVAEAAAFFHTLLQQINCDQPDFPLTPDDFVFVPGNHDLVWTDPVDARWEKYRAFLTAFYGKIPDCYDQEDFTVIRTYEESKIAFLGFNSCGLDKCQPHKDIRAFCEAIPTAEYQRDSIDKTALLNLFDRSNVEQYDDYGEIPTRQLAKQRRKMEGRDDFTSVALFHHHFFLFPDIAGKVGDTDVVGNHAALVRDLRAIGVKTVLHGHKHFDLERPFINEDYYDTTDSIIDVFAGGSVGAGGLLRHTFSVLDFFPKQGDIRTIQNKFIYKEDHLDPICCKQIPPQSKAPQVVKLLELLEREHPDIYQDYLNTAMANQRLYNICETIIRWVGEALTGFPEVCRYLATDSVTLLFLLFSIHGRALHFLCSHNSAERDKYDAYAKMFQSFFNRHLKGHVPADYGTLFQAAKLSETAKLCDKMLEQTPERNKKQYLAFSMVGLFFSDLYLVMTEYADDFYKQISHKVNIKLEPNHFHTNVPAARIVLTSDADRRSAYVNLLCNDATSHKLAVLFVKEFDLTISKYEDYFKLIGLKLYYLLPKIDKNPKLDALDNYNFEAYIPTLLPLLTGDNIYHSKEVFARELIQNSIDAISVREAVEGPLCAKDRTIYIDLGTDGDGRRYFQITDHGTGMDRYKIERYFTSIGRSFYSGEDYAELGITYKPISNFGIGFLSSFMVCQEIDVQTRSFEGEQEGLKLHIPNYEGCFFIERDQDAETGTRIRLYLTDVTDNNKIVHYIESVIRDISYPIQITRNRARPRTIPAHSARKTMRDRDYLFFVPFLDDGTVGTLEWCPQLHTEAFPYGLSICAADGKSGRRGPLCTLNAGILAGDHFQNNPFSHSLRPTAFQSSGFLLKDPSFLWHDATINFPANWIQMDVSREKVVGLSAWLNNKDHTEPPKGTISARIAEELQRQFIAYLNYILDHDDNRPAAAVQEFCSLISQFAKSCSPEIVAWAQDRSYAIQINMGEQAADFRLALCADGESCITFHPVKKKDLIPRIKKLFRPIGEPQISLVETADADTSEKLNIDHTIFLRDDFYTAPFLHPSTLHEAMNWSEQKLGYRLLMQILSLYENSRMQPKKSVREQVLRMICSLLLYRFSVAQVERGEANLTVPYDTSSLSIDS